MNNTQILSATASVVLCSMSAAVEADAKMIMDRLSASGIYVYNIMHAENNPAAALRLAAETQSKCSGAYIGIVTDKPLGDELRNILLTRENKGCPVYCFMHTDGGDREILKLEAGGLIPVEKTEDEVTLAVGRAAAVPALQASQQASYGVPYAGKAAVSSADKKKKNTIIIVSVLLACLLILLPMVQCARGCALCGGPVYIDHEYVDTTSDSQQDENEDSDSGLLGALLDTPSDNMSDYDYDELDKLMEERAEGDFVYQQYVDGNVKGLGYISKYTGTDKNVTLPTKLGGIEIVGTLMAFEENDTITSVTIPDGYINIGIDTFCKCTSLKSVSIPDTVTEINENAFYECSSLESVNIPGSVSNIGKYAFYRCASLKSLIIPEGVRTLGHNSFAECTSLTSLAIPDSVTEAGEYLCNGCERLAEVTLGAGMRTVPRKAFNSCSSLKKVTFGKNTDTIGEYAFNQSGVSEIDLPDSVRSIGEGAFYACESLKRVSLPSLIDEPGNYMFTGCSSLKRIDVRGIGKQIKETDGVLFSADGSVLLAYPCGREGQYDVPEGTSVIGQGAFCRAEKLTAVTLPDSLETIEFEAFYGCGIKEISFPDGVKTVGGSAFCLCENLETAYIGAKTENLDGNPFMYCPKLASIEVSPANKRFKMNGGLLVSLAEKSVVSSINSVKDALIIPNGIKGISPCAFNGNSGITSVSFPKSLETIGNHSFEDCASLADISFGGHEQVIEYYAFAGCDSLTSVSLPDSLTIVGQHSFGKCSSLTDVRIGAGAEDINMAFCSCEKLKNIEITGDRLVDISGAFQNCTSLEYFAVADSVTDVSIAFSNCTALKYVVLGENIDKIDLYVFKGCESLRALYVPAKMEFHTGWIADCPLLEKIYYGGTSRQWEMNLRPDQKYPKIPESVVFEYDCETPPDFASVELQLNSNPSEKEFLP